MELLLSGQRARLVLLEAKKLGGEGLTVTVQPQKRRPPASDRMGTLA